MTHRHGDVKDVTQSVPHPPLSPPWDLSSIFLPWVASFSHFPPLSPDRWMTPRFLSHSPPSPPPFCPHLWLLPSAVIPCLPCFTLHPRWAACSSCIMYECPFVSRGAGAIVKQSKFGWLILKAEKRRAKKLALTYCCLCRTSNKCFVVCVFIGAERDGFIILRFSWGGTTAAKKMSHCVCSKNMFLREANQSRRRCYVLAGSTRAWISHSALWREKGHILGLTDKLYWLQSDFFCKQAPSLI